MHWLGWLVVMFAILEGGWFAFDGAHALITGDYVTPRSGRFAGQLGPWSKLVSKIGIEPRSTFMKTIHLILGVVWVSIILCFIFHLSWTWWGMLSCAIGGLWYLPFGTLLSILQIIILLLPALRDSHLVR